MTEEIVIKAFGAILSGLVLLVLGRWASKLTKSLDDQMVVNAKVAGTIDLVAERLHGHCLVADTRHEAIKDRIISLERDVAHRTGRA